MSKINQHTLQEARRKIQSADSNRINYNKHCAINNATYTKKKKHINKTMIHPKVRNKLFKEWHKCFLNGQKGRIYAEKNPDEILDKIPIKQAESSYYDNIKNINKIVAEESRKYGPQNASASATICI